MDGGLKCSKFSHNRLEHLTIRLRRHSRNWQDGYKRKRYVYYTATNFSSRKKKKLKCVMETWQTTTSYRRKSGEVFQHGMMDTGSLSTPCQFSNLYPPTLLRPTRFQVRSRPAEVDHIFDHAPVLPATLGPGMQAVQTFTTETWKIIIRDEAKPIYYTCEYRKQIGELRGDIGTITYVYRLLSETPIITHKKQTVQPGNEFEDNAFRPGYEIVKFWTRL